MAMATDREYADMVVGLPISAGRGVFLPACRIGDLRSRMRMPGTWNT